MKVRIAPSILSADFARLAEEIRSCQEGGADMIHIDVMDGCFVPNLTFGAKVIETVRGLTRLPLDVHLMVVQPEKYVEDFAAAGADTLSVHIEAAPHVHRQIQRIRDRGCKAGVALNPGSSLELVREIAAEIDLLLVMTVNPGFGGQRFIQSSLDKVARARALLNQTGSAALLEVDGGVDRGNIAALWHSGADTFVAGTSIFGARDARAEIGHLRGLCAEVA
jgi:ribulose-phosphate 3-epimerase